MLKPDSYVQPNVTIAQPLLSFQQERSHTECVALKNVSENTLTAKNQVDHPPEELVDRSHTDSESHFSSNSDDELLDAASLQTVLDMLDVIDCVEELELLETLTIAQKKQVWALTPEATRLKLKQIRAVASNPTDIRSLSSAALMSASTATQERAPVETNEVDEFTNEVKDVDETSDLGVNLDTDLDTDDVIDVIDEADLDNAVPDALWHEAVKSLAERQVNQATDPLLQTGNWVVLRANPKLTMVEMIAVWEVVEVQGKYARIKAERVGIRNYPIAWMVIYPKPPSDAMENTVAGLANDINTNDINTDGNNIDNDDTDDADDDNIEF